MQSLGSYWRVIASGIRWFTLIEILVLTQRSSLFSLRSRAYRSCRCLMACTAKTIVIGCELINVPFLTAQRQAFLPHIPRRYCLPLSFGVSQTPRAFVHWGLLHNHRTGWRLVLRPSCLSTSLDHHTHTRADFSRRDHLLHPSSNWRRRQLVGFLNKEGYAYLDNGHEPFVG